MLQAFAEWYCKKIVRIVDTCSGELYLTRYFLFGSTYSKYALMLHHIHRSDLDRHMHDHPWNFWSFVLTGGYLEYTPNGRGVKCDWYGPGSLLQRPASWQHRLILPRPMWTLVFRTERRRSWGFYTENGWVDYNDYDFEAGCE